MTYCPEQPNEASRWSVLWQASQRIVDTHAGRDIRTATCATCAPREVCAHGDAGGDVELTEAEKAEIWKLIDEFEVKGDRYYGMDPKAMHLWG